MAVQLPEIDVAAGVLRDSQGRVLIAQRPAGSHQEGWWEFPGGKLSVNETPADALRRELAEELGIAVKSAETLITYTHVYPECKVNLHVSLVLDYDGQPASAEGQALRWISVDKLLEAGLLPADEPIVNALLALTDR